jgi:DNA-binding NarL/FixJ family response regulator
MKEKRSEETGFSRKSSKIMIIDDEEKLLLAIKKYLITQGFKVIICNSGTAALSKLNNERIDLIIIDVLMSDINGYDLVKQLKTCPNIGHIPFIFLTAKGMTEDRIKGYKMGCKAYLAKPFDPEELVAIIDNVLSDRKNIQSILNIKSKIKQIRRYIYKFDELNEYKKFTTRERTILLAVSNGLSNKDIAHNLNISVRNVENYITRLLHKTNSANRIKLASYRYLLNKGE